MRIRKEPTGLSIDDPPHERKVRLTATWNGREASDSVRGLLCEG